MPVPDNRSHPATASAAPAFSAPGIPWNEAAAYAHDYARRFCKHRRHQHLAEEVAQESLVKLLKSASRIRVGWRELLTTIVANTARTKLGAERTRLVRICLDGTSTDLARGHGPTPFEESASADIERFASSLLCRLDSEFGRGTRAILELRAGPTKVPWDEISRIVRLAKRTCTYRHKKAMKWFIESIDHATGDRQ
jgi:hypothetical protein